MLTNWQELRERILMRLSALGFWVSQAEPQFPHPRDFVGVHESGHAMERLTTYLGSGYPLTSYMGFSFCRFGCLASPEMGSSDLTDGIWVWPEGLSHYLKAHNVVLPGKFIQHAKGNFWTIPEIAEGLSNDYDFSFWLSLRHNA